MNFILQLFRRLLSRQTHDDNLRADDVHRPVSGYAVMYKDKQY